MCAQRPDEEQHALPIRAQRVLHADKACRKEPPFARSRDIYVLRDQLVFLKELSHAGFPSI